MREVPKLIENILAAPHNESAALKLLNDIITILNDEEIANEAALREKIDALRKICETRTKNSVQNELFPVFKPQKSVELKKEFALNFGSIERIEKDYPELLSIKLTSGKTLQWHLNEIRDWFNNLRGEDLGNWIKLFAYVKSVKSFSETGAEAINFKDSGNG